MTKYFAIGAFLCSAVTAPALAHEPGSSYGSPGFGYPAGFGYQPQSPSSRFGTEYGHGHRRPSREVTTIRPLEGGGHRIETRRYYGRGGTGRINASPPWQRRR